MTKKQSNSENPNEWGYKSCSTNHKTIWILLTEKREKEIGTEQLFLQEQVITNRLIRERNHRGFPNEVTKLNNVADSCCV